MTTHYEFLVAGTLLVLREIQFGLPENQSEIILSIPYEEAQRLGDSFKIAMGQLKLIDAAKKRDQMRETKKRLQKERERIECEQAALLDYEQEHGIIDLSSKAS